MPRPHEAVVWFGHEMLKKLDANSHKRGWDSLDLDYAATRLRQELQELENELLFYDFGAGDPRHADEIIQECADIANFALFVAWRFKETRDTADPEEG